MKNTKQQRVTLGVTSDKVVCLFNTTFSTDKTVLIGGADEPLYRPATDTKPAMIQFRLDYLRSALHEVAHWCVAGPARRSLPDYGYWYSPDDRNADEQAAFFAVEARPQALESLFCEALGIPFAASIDNLTLSISEAERREFDRRIAAAKAHYQRRGLPVGAQKFVAALSVASDTQAI